MRAAFKEKAAQAQEKRDLPAILLSIKDGWDDDRINALASAPIEEYQKAFKSHSGVELRRMLSNAFQFDRIVNASAAMREISRRAHEALKLIGAEFPINARRVSRFEVKTEQAGDGSGPVQAPRARTLPFGRSSRPSKTSDFPKFSLTPPPNHQ